MSLTAQGIENYLKNDVEVFAFEEIDSTNNEAKRSLERFSGVPMLFACDCQTNGRGSKGRSFFSPKGTGLYMTVMLPLADGLESTQKLTCAAAVATAKAIESLRGVKTKIKWVNDVLIDDKKVCGILSEVCSDNDNVPKAVVIGIGINLTTESFPEEFRAQAGSVGDVDPEQLCATVTDNLLDEYRNIAGSGFYDEYVKRNNFLGKEVVFSNGVFTKTAKAVGLEKDGSLVLERNGYEITVKSGEISIKVQ